MEEIEKPKPNATVRFVVLSAALLVMIVVLGVLLLVALEAAEDADAQTRSYLARMAWLFLIMLLLTVLCLFWLSIRYLIIWTRTRARRHETPYVNAWAMAGQRFKLDEEDRSAEDGGDEQGDSQHSTEQ